MSWMDLPLKKRIKIAKKISITLKRKGIRPPSNKGKSFSKEHVNKIIEAKRKNGSLYHTPERTKKIQKARKVFYDKVGRKSKLVYNAVAEEFYWVADTSHPKTDKVVSLYELEFKYYAVYHSTFICDLFELLRQED